MAMIDYVTLMLVNMAAGFVILGWFLARGPCDAQAERKWAAALAAPGLVALLTGLHMIWVWPLPGSYNGAFGEPSVMLGAVLLGLALAVGQGWSPAPAALYGFFGGILSLVIGARIANLSGTQENLTAQPALSALGFLLSGLGGILTAPALFWRQNRLLRMAAALALFLAALVWFIIGYGGVWMHLTGFQHWIPATARMPH